MSTLSAFMTNIEQVLIDLRSDKTTVRTKSLENLHSYFDSRSDDLHAIFKSNNNSRRDNDDDNESLSWTSLFNGLHNAIRNQCALISASRSQQTQKTLIAKNDAYKEVLRKCINLANERTPNVPYKQICQVAFDCFGTPEMSSYFDALYLQIIYKHILNSKHNIGELSKTEWSRILSYVFELRHQQITQVQQLELLQCIPLIVRHASKYTYLVIDLHQHLPDIIQIVNAGELQNQIRSQQQIFLIVYEFIRSLAVNQRSSIVNFTESVLEKLLKFYNFSMDTDSKVILMKIMHISIVVHSPEPFASDVNRRISGASRQSNDLFQKDIAEDVGLWNKHLRNMMSVVEREIAESRKRSNRLNPTPTICPIFVRMAAKLCSVVFWNEDIWTNGSANDEQQNKRRRHSMQLEKILEFIEYEPSKFCWRWFAVLSQLLTDFPHVLQAEDYQSLLKLLTDFKPTIQYSLLMKCFNRIVEVMLNKENDLKKGSTQIMETFCTEHWHEIMELSFKQAETDKTQSENIELIRILIDNQVIVSHDFIKNIIIAVAKTQTIRKSNSSIRLLISVLRSVNTDMIDGIDSLKKVIIQWLSSKIKLTELKKVIENNQTIDKHLVSELYVHCVLSRKESTLNKRYGGEIDVNHDVDVQEYESFIAELVQNLQYRMLSKLIVSDITLANNMNVAHKIDTLPESDGLKAVLNDNMFGELDRALQDGNTSNDTSIENFTSICASLSTNVNILNSLVGYESIDGEYFLKYLDKRVFIKIQGLNFIVEQFGNSYRIDRNPNDVNEILDGLLSIWHVDYHPIIMKNIFQPKHCKHIINWLQTQLKPSQQSKSLILAPLKMASQLSFAERIQLKCLMLLAHFCEHQDGEDSEVDAFKGIEEYNFKLKRNEDLFIMFELIKIILNQECPPDDHVEWAFEKLQNVCEQLVSYCDYMELVIDQIPALIKCVKPDSDMHSELIELITPILLLCKRKKFGQHLTIKMIQNVQYFAKEFFDVEDSFVILAFMQHFLKFEYYNIQMAAVSCLTKIFNKEWLQLNEDQISCLSVQKTHVKLEKELKIDELSVVKVNDNDRKACIASVRIQLYCSIIGVCYPLREEIWFNLIEFCGQQLELNDSKLYEIVEKLSTEVFNHKASVLLADLVPHLITQWIDKNYLLATFPIILTECQTRNDFIIEYQNTIILRIIQHKLELVPELEKMYQENLSNILTTEILIKTLAWLTSVNSLVDRTQREKAVKVLTMLRKYKPNIDTYFDSHSLEIIEELLNGMWDAEKFTQFFEANVEFMTNGNTTNNYDLFIKSLEYIRKKSSKPSNVIHHFCVLSPRKVTKMLYSLKLTFQNAMDEESKLAQMLRVCVLIEIIVDFLIENADNSHQMNVIGFFVRDIVHFLGNTINSNYTDKLKLSACKYFHKLCQRLLPSCATHFQCHLNYIVSILMPIVKTKQPTKMSQAGMNLLSFLIADQTDVLNQAIGQLDSFPFQSEFDQLREIQCRVKYNGTTFSLLDEINYFLLVDKRKVEGLLSLKEHLSKKKNELQHIYNTIYDTRGFSEDCEKSPIHRLISALLSQIVQNVDTEKSLIAAKCLGELGPNDLGSIALKFDIQSQTYKICNSFDEAVTNLCELALEKLNAIFIHSDATVLQAASDACEQILKSRKAVTFLDKYPLLSVFETGAVTDLPLKNQNGNLDLLKLFSDDAFKKGHTFWVKSLAIELFTFFDGASLASVAALQTSFAVSMVPLLIKALLTTTNKSHCNALKKAVDLFFAQNFNKLTSESMEVDDAIINAEPPVYLDKVSIKLMLNVAECVRIHNQNSTGDEQLQLNYSHIAKAALFCEAYFTAILYGELASCEKLSQDQEENNQEKANKTIQIRSIMKDAYQAIGETDAVPAFLDPIEQKMEYLVLNRCWDQILIGLDAQSDNFSQYATYLSQAGLYNLANRLTQGNNSTNYECAWRLADWNIVEGSVSNSPAQNDDTSVEFHKFHYFALKNLKARDQIGVKKNIERALSAVVKMFKQSSYECTKNIYKNLMMLQLLQQVDEFCHIQFRNMNDENYGPEFLINKWKYQDQIASCGFDYREPILAQRITMLQSIGVRAKRSFENKYNLSNSLIPQMILNLVTECREEGFFDFGQRYSATLQKMELSREMKMKTLIEDAQLSWHRGEGEMAQHMIDKVINEKTPTFTHAKALGMKGQYLADARLEDTNIIIKSYLQDSVTFSATIKKNGEKFREKPYYHPEEEREQLDLENRKRNYRAIAKYADREYQQIAAYMKSAEFENKMANIRRNKDVYSNMEQRKSTFTTDERKSYVTLANFIRIDESDVNSTRKEYEHYLHIAIEYYIETLLLETDNATNGSAIFRLFGLWFSNSNNEDILKEIDENYKRIATYKFISLMPQITTHLSTEVIKDVIQDIVFKCAVDHPHHVLPKVFALVNAFKDEIYIKDPKQKTKTVSSSPRTDAAAKLLQRLKGDARLRDTIIEMERMNEALIQLANTKNENPKDYEISSKQPIRHLRDLNLVHCPTVHLPIRCSGDYSQSKVGISKWKSKFMPTSGITLPKRIECIGSNGVQYSQLLKGTDDLRQDAVMQQVFNIMNDMLNQSKVTKKDRLHVRTYVVVPLSQRSGILEWCDKTMPLTDYLVGKPNKPGAHERFRPNDMKPADCRKKLSQASIRLTTFDKTLKTFQNVCEHIKPVFHHFFLEHFYNPGVWFERRMAYAHSLATTSMIGYILGIGDRHVNNILIDTATAELIHIDFGIAFEQGKCLPTPELIPFRLTRDLISALGPSGVEGVFRKSCEKTMEVLRQNKSTIMTIVEVLLHDPLYGWALTSSKAKQRQDLTVQINEDQDINTMAERALWRLEEKLDGKHVSRSEAISVKRHVEILIKEARNERLLCKLFVGWQPYL